MARNGTAQRLNVAEAKRQFSDLLGRVAYGGETVVITRRGRPMAQLVPADASDTRAPASSGFLDDDDPFFTIVDEIVAARSSHGPRVIAARKRRR